MPSSEPKAAPTGDLNPRQLGYLQAAYEIDQRQEAYHKRSFNSGDWNESRRPASEWRWIPFGRFLHLRGQPPTPLREACPDVDEGSGSTWTALARRGLLVIQDRPVYQAAGAYQLPHVLLYPRGRKLARSLQTPEVQAPPKGSNSRWTWRALATAYAAGEDGVPGQGGGAYGGIGWGTWLVLRNHRGGDLVEEFVHHQEAQPLIYDPGHTRDVWHIRITPAGRAYYLKRWEANVAAHPDVDAPNPHPL